MAREKRLLEGSDGDTDTDSDDTLSGGRCYASPDIKAVAETGTDNRDLDVLSPGRVKNLHPCHCNCMSVYTLIFKTLGQREAPRTGDGQDFSPCTFVAAHILMDMRYQLNEVIC